MKRLRWIPGGVTAPRGIVASGTWSGIKRNRRFDLALIVSETPATVAGMLTTNRVKAAPVLLAARALRRGWARAVLVNSGCANCMTGAAGARDAQALLDAAARLLGIAPREILPASTGIIGRRLPVPRIVRALPRLVGRLGPKGHREAAWAILTTDTHPKETAVEWRRGARHFRLGGMAKGAGMIGPRMATMLAFFTTDVAIAPTLLRRALRSVCEATFNRITVDGDTSTNDTVLVLATGLAGGPPIAAEGPAYRRFAQALHAAAQELAVQLVRDGEGATKVAEIRVTGARTPREATLCADTLATSPLVKTMLAGGEYNPGRLAAAAGRSGARFRAERLRIAIHGHTAAAHGVACPPTRAVLHALRHEERVVVEVALGAGRARAQAWTCDLTEEYVRINARYTT